MPLRESSLSEFLQHSGRAFPALEEGPILLRRRDGEDLVLMTRGQSDALQVTARAFLALSSGHEDAIGTVLPWIVFLGVADRQDCIQELREVGAAALQTGRLARLAETLYTWEATALAAWDERRNHERLGISDEQPIDVHRPGR